ncbi:unnamed protein product [Cuscuta europaea]|uniref:Uncharacterized protein n=1 Tax=Cuscuta europaea TaxID=41803 RepID=A0A9P1A2E6_CUSEU|nr:unnamed protein product [Cuscuta europaea]
MVCDQINRGQSRLIIFFLVLFIASSIIASSIYVYQHPDPKAPAYSVLDVPLTTNGSSRFTGGGTVTFILNTRNRNKRKYTNDYGTSQASLYLGAPAQEMVANATLAALLQPPRASSNLTLTFLAPAAALDGGASTVVLKIQAPFRYDGYTLSSIDRQLEVTCNLPYDSSQLQAFHLPNKCHVLVQSCYSNRYGTRRCY